MATDDQRAEATARLSAEDRALIELFDRRGLSAEEISAVIGLSPGEVERRHRAAQARLAEQLERDRSVPANPRANRRALLLVAAAVVLVGVVVAIAASAGGGGSSSDAGSSTGPSSTTASGTETTPAEAGPVTMQRLNGTYGRGTAQLQASGDSATVRIRASHFLRPVGGGYAVWLRGGAADRRLYATTDTTIDRSFRLPSDYADYRYVEVARAIPQLDSDYSGLVLLRARVDALTGP